VVYLDTGCLVKLYYPERESAAVTTAVVGEQIAFTALHELEMVTAMQLKVFRGEAKPEQVVAAMDAVQGDVGAGKLIESPTDWRSTFREAIRLAQTHAAVAGCRSLDTLHCALAKAVDPSMFLSSDARQIKLARAAGLRRFGNLNSLFESNTIFAEFGKITFDSPDFLDMTAQTGNMRRVKPTSEGSSSKASKVLGACGGRPVYRASNRQADRGS